MKRILMFLVAVFLLSFSAASLAADKAVTFSPMSFSLGYPNGFMAQFEQKIGVSTSWTAAGMFSGGYHKSKDQAKEFGVEGAVDFGLRYYFGQKAPKPFMAPKTVNGKKTMVQVTPPIPLAKGFFIGGTAGGDLVYQTVGYPDASSVKSSTFAARITPIMGYKYVSPKGFVVDTVGGLRLSLGSSKSKVTDALGQEAEDVQKLPLFTPFFGLSLGFSF